MSFYFTLIFDLSERILLHTKNKIIQYKSLLELNILIIEDNKINMFIAKKFLLK